MKNALLLITILSVSALSSCKKDVKDDDSITVTYSASSSPGGFIVKYQNENGGITQLTIPGKDWEIAVKKKKGDYVYIWAQKSGKSDYLMASIAYGNEMKSASNSSTNDNKIVTASETL